MSARDEVLARIRSANAAAGARAEEVARTYDRVGPLAPGSHEVIELLVDRLLDYHAEVTSIDAAADIPTAVEAALSDAPRVLVPDGLTDGWVHPSRQVADRPLLSAPELDAVDAVVTTATVAAAETGTIVLDGSAGQGRRAVSLVPDLHVVVLRADQVVHSVPEMLARLDPIRAITLISGPSATSDIELQRVEGVHGPRRLRVVLVGS